MPYSRGDVILVPFPFSDLSGGKKRPGVVISADSHIRAQNDLIVAQISSQVSNPVPPDEYKIVDWHHIGLLFPSVVRPKLFTLEDSIVLKPLGHLPIAEMLQIDQRLRMVLAL
jgi:mRNA interferase MazF